MPKINVYLPDDLADAVRDTGVPVSAVCQRSLAEAVRRVAEVRTALAGDAPDEGALAQLTQLTARTRSALALGLEQARSAGAPSVGTGHLLGGILAEGTNLAVRVLAAVEVEPGLLAADLRAGTASEAPIDAVGEGLRFSAPAAAALQLAVTEAIGLDHNYLGCEHLLLGLAAETEGAAGEALRARGAEHRTLRRAVVAALVGYVHLRAQGQQPPGSPAPGDLVAAVVRRELAPLLDRLTALEQRVGATDGS